MATAVAKNWYFLLNAVDLSAHVRSLSWKPKQNTGVDTAGANVTAEEYQPTIKDGDLTVVMNNVLGAGGPEATLWAVFDGAVAVSASWGPDGATAGAATPVMTGSVVLTDYNPFDGTVGDKMEITANFKASGAVTRDITP